MKCKLLIISLIALFAGAVTASDALFENRKSDWKIVLSSTASEAENTAATELQQMLLKISGAKLPVERADELSSTHHIVLGTPESSGIVKGMNSTLKLTGGDQDEIAIFTHGGNLYLCGNRPRAVFYAVQAFLQKELGVRYFWQGEDGTFVKPQGKYVLPELAVFHRSPFIYRELSFSNTPGPELSMEFLARNFVNMGPPWYQTGHHKYGFEIFGTCHSVHLDPELYKTKPEMFTMLDGKRVFEEESRGCYSNPETVEYLIKRQSELIKQHQLDLLYSYPSDNGNYCVCPECSKNSDIPGRWFEFYTKMVRALKKEHPSLKVATVAYQEYAQVPEKAVEDVLFVNYCQYDRCYVHKLNDPACEWNKNSMAKLAEWEKKAPMGIYGYELDIYAPQITVPFGYMLEDELNVFAARNIRSVYMEGSDELTFGEHKKYGLNPNRFNNYLYAQLAWDPSRKADDLLQDWCQTLYGSASIPMVEYHKIMMNAWMAMPFHIGYFFNNYVGTARHLLNDQRIAEIQAKFDEAEKIAGAISEPAAKKLALEQIGIEKKFFGAWVNAYKLTSLNFTVFNLPEADSFANAVTLPLNSKEGMHKRTGLKAYYTQEALHLLVECTEEDMQSLNRSAENCWGDDSIEMLIDTRNGKDFHLSFGLGGKSYSAVSRKEVSGLEWSYRVQERATGWTAEITLPFKTLGGVPTKNAEWGFSLNRNGKPEACGFPYPVYGDTASTATIRFSGKDKSPGNIAFLNSPVPVLGYLQKNWNISSFGVDEAKKASFAGNTIFFVRTLDNALPMEFYRDKLFPYVKENGGIIFFQAYGSLPLEQYTGSSDWGLQFAENFGKIQMARYPHGLKIAKQPNDLEKILPAWGFSSVYLPAASGQWQVVAERVRLDETWGPVLLYRPWGKGFVFVATGGEQLPELLENVALLNN